MILLEENKTLKRVLFRDKSIGKIFVGMKLVWPEADLYGIKAASFCNTHSAFVLRDGSFWTAGSNLHGQLCRLGDSGSWDKPNLEQVPGIDDAEDVAVSATSEREGSTVLLCKYGRIRSAGFSSSSSLAVSEKEKTAFSSLGRDSVSGSPTFSNFSEIFGVTFAQKIWHENGRLFVQQRDRRIYGYGLDWDANRGLLRWMTLRNAYGETFTCSDFSFRMKAPVALQENGTVSVFGPMTDWHRPVELPASQTSSLRPYDQDFFLTEIGKIRTGTDHMAALTTDGSVRMVGSDHYGQLCSPKFRFRNPEKGYLLEDRSVRDVVCGDNHTVILYWDGKVKTGGKNDRGQLGRDVPVGNGHDWLYYTGNDRVTGEGWFGNFGEVPGIQDAIAVYAGGDCTMIVARSGIYIFGNNDFGQLGIRTASPVFNSADRLSWRESWTGTRDPFRTNLVRGDLFQ